MLECPFQIAIGNIQLRPSQQTVQNAGQRHDPRGTSTLVVTGKILQCQKRRHANEALWLGTLLDS